MLSKSVLHWPAAQTGQTNPRQEPNLLAASQHDLLDAQASISNDPHAKPKPNVKPVVSGSQAPTRQSILTSDDLRVWANSMTAEPIMMILDRWPDEELPQHRTKPAPVEQPSPMNIGTTMMVTIMFTTLLAVLMIIFRKVSGARRQPSRC